MAVLFYVFAFLAILGALTVITSRNPVRAVLALVFTFVATAVLWLLVEAEFLALVLIVVYVGAVMVLFLFVVMMLDIKTAASEKHWVGYWPLAILCGIVMIALLVWVFVSPAFGLIAVPAPTELPADYSNISVLGMALFSHYIYPFEVAGVLLLAAMIAAITLTHRQRQGGVKAQMPSRQVKVSKKDRLTIVKMTAEKPKNTGAAT